MRQLARHNETVETWDGLKSRSSSLLELLELALLEGDFSLEDLLAQEASEIEEILAREEINLTLSGAYDERSAIVSIHAGRRRHRLPRLGGNASAHVRALGRNREEAGAGDGHVLRR